MMILRNGKIKLTSCLIYIQSTKEFMMFQYLFFLSLICCTSVLSTVIFYLIAMNTDDAEGLGIWGAVISIITNLAFSTAISVLIIIFHLR